MMHPLADDRPTSVMSMGLNTTEEIMSHGLRSACDAILQKVVTGKPRVPGEVALITDRSDNV